MTDTSMFILFFLYFRLRYNNPELMLPHYYSKDEYKHLKDELDYGVLSMLSFMNSIIVISALIKVFFFFKVLDKVGTLVKLIHQSIKEIFLFLLFFMFIIFTFSFIFHILGI